MGKPAARATDMVKTCNDPVDMPTCQIIAMGTVFINKLPAAKMNDQVVGVDIHIVLIPSPGGPVPTPLPHPYMGRLQMNCSPTVKIMGQMAATQGSKSMMSPPHIPQGGPFQKPPTNIGEVMLGSPNVMIGGGGGGGGGGGAGAEATSGGAVGSGGEGGGGGGSQEGEAHFLDVEVTDKGGFPVIGGQYALKSPSGQTTTAPLAAKIERSVQESGNYEITLQAITKAEWSAKEARGGEKVKLQIETVGYEDGTKVVMSVWQKDLNRPDELVKRFEEIEISGGKAEAEWQYEWPDDGEDDADHDDASFKAGEAPSYSAPKFYFTATIGEDQAKSAYLGYRDYIELDLQDAEGKAVADAEYRVFLSNGEIREGKLDGNGYAKIEDVPPGEWDVMFPGMGAAEEYSKEDHEDTSQHDDDEDEDDTQNGREASDDDNDEHDTQRR